MRPVYPKIIAILVLIFSTLGLFLERPSFKYFNRDHLKLAFQAPYKPKFDHPMYIQWAEEANEARRQFLLSRIRDALLIMALFIAIISSIVVIIHDSRIWGIVLGSASSAALVISLIRDIGFVIDSLMTDISGTIFFVIYCTIYLISAAYFLTRGRWVVNKPV